MFFARDRDTGRRDLIVRRAAWLVLFVGVALRIAQYAANRSFWVDEASLAANISDGSMATFARSLERDQIAPFAFLVVERLLVVLFGTSEWIFRLFSLVAGVAVLPLFWIVARRLLGPVAALPAVALFAFSRPLIYFASEVKQYSSDAAVAVVVLWVAVWCLDRPIDQRRLLIGALIGAASAWVSHVAVFTLAAAGVTLIAARAAEHRWEDVRRVALMSAAWCASFVGSFLVTRQAVPAATMAYMSDYWRDYFLLPTPESTPPAAHMASVIAGFFVDPVGFHTPYKAVAVVEPLLPNQVPLILAGLAPPLMVLGALALWRQRARAVAALLLLPHLGLLAASAVRAYPFGGRTSTFLIPPTLLLFVAGARFVWSWARRSLALQVAVTAAGIGVFVPPLREALSLPYDREELRDLLRWVAADRQSGDGVYVYVNALPVVDFYQRIRGIDLGEYVAGITARDKPELYRSDVRRMSGRERVWIVLGHDYQPNGASEWAVLLDELDKMGRRVRCEDRPGARVCLYDLKSRPPNLLLLSGNLRRSESPTRTPARTARIPA